MGIFKNIIVNKGLHSVFVCVGMHMHLPVLYVHA